MKKSALCVLAVLAGSVSTSAVAKDLKQNEQPVSATQMNDSEMEKMTAGFIKGRGIETAHLDFKFIFRGS